MKYLHVSVDLFVVPQYEMREVVSKNEETGEEQKELVKVQTGYKCYPVPKEQRVTYRKTKAPNQPSCKKNDWGAQWYLDRRAQGDYTRKCQKVSEINRYEWRRLQEIGKSDGV